MNEVSQLIALNNPLEAIERIRSTNVDVLFLLGVGMVITSESLECILTELPNLTSIKRMDVYGIIEYNEVVKISDALKRCPFIHEVCITGMRCAEECELNFGENVKKLTLAGNINPSNITGYVERIDKIEDLNIEGAWASSVLGLLSNKFHLKTLRLESCEFNDDNHLKHIVGEHASVHLKKLEFGDCWFTDLQILTNLMATDTSIEELVVYGSINDHSSAPIEHVLRVNTTLRRLCLSHNSLMNMNGVFEGLKWNTTLKELRISGSTIDDLEGIAHNATLERLDIIYCMNVSEKCLRTLSQNKHLKVLGLSGNYIEDISPLFSSYEDARIEKLCLSQNLIQDICPIAGWLETNTSLNDLTISDNPVGGVFCLMDALKRNTRIETLSMRGIDIPTHALTEVLKDSSSLKHVYFHIDNLEMLKAMEEVVLLNSNITSLSIDGREEHAILRHLTSLNTLNLNNRTKTLYELIMNHLDLQALFPISS